MANERGLDGEDRIVAVGLLTRKEFTLFGAQLSRLYPVEDDNRFADLIEAIDSADSEYQRNANRSG